MNRPRRPGILPLVSEPNIYEDGLILVESRELASPKRCCATTCSFRRWPRPGPSGRIRYPSSIRSAGSSSSARQGTSPQANSRIMKLGMVLTTWAEPADDTGPAGLWGATSSLRISAAPAIFSSRPDRHHA